MIFVISNDQLSVETEWKARQSHLTIITLPLSVLSMPGITESPEHIIDCYCVNEFAYAQFNSSCLKIKVRKYLASKESCWSG